LDGVGIVTLAHREGKRIPPTEFTVVLASQYRGGENSRGKTNSIEGAIIQEPTEGQSKQRLFTVLRPGTGTGERE